MIWFAAILVACCVLSVPVAVVIGRAIALADRRSAKVTVVRGTARRWSL